MDTCTIARLAVGIDGAAVPDGAQRLDRRLDDAARGLAVGRRDHADAAGIGFKVGAIHAVFGKPLVIGGRVIGHVVVPAGMGVGQVEGLSRLRALATASCSAS